MSEDWEKNIEKFLYEEHAKGVLRSDSSQSNNKRIILAIAASLIIVCAFLFLFQTDNRAEFISSNYEFPEIHSSRAAMSVWSSKLKIAQKDGWSSEDLSLFSGRLNEEQKYYYAHVLFALDSLDAADNIIRTTSWKNNFFESDVRWLSFLGSLKKNDSKDVLKEKFQFLDQKHQTLAHPWID